MLQTSVAAAEPFVPARARSEIVRRVVLYVLLVAIALLFFTPFVWTLSTSFKTLPDTANFNFIPHPFTTAAWKTSGRIRLQALHPQQPLPRGHRHRS